MIPTPRISRGATTRGSVLNNGQNLIGARNTELAVANRQQQPVIGEIELRKAADTAFLVIGCRQTRIAKFSDGWIPVTRGILKRHTSLGGCSEKHLTPLGS